MAAKIGYKRKINIWVDNLDSPDTFTYALDTFLYSVKALNVFETGLHSLSQYCDRYLRVVPMPNYMQPECPFKPNKWME